MIRHAIFTADHEDALREVVHVCMPKTSTEEVPPVVGL